MPNIVIADPEKGLRQTILEILKPFKHNLFEAEDGEQVLKFVKEKKIHAVLFDADLTTKEGADLIREVKKIRKSTAVVAMVSLGEDSKVHLSRGAFTTITKPFNVQVLRRVVSEAVDNARLAAPPLVSWKKRFLVFAAVFMLLAGGAAGHYFWKLKRVPIKFYSIAYANLTSIASDGKWLWTCDWYNQSVYRHTPDAVLSLSRTFTREDFHPSAAAWDGNNLWTYAAWENKLVKNKMDETLAVEQTWDTPDLQPYAMSFDGKEFWFCDEKKALLGRFLPESALVKVLETFQSPGKNPVGICKAKDFLWSADGGTGLLYKHSLDKGYPVLEAYALPDEAQKDKITCFWSDGEIFWVGLGGAQKIFQFRKNHLKLAASND